MRITLNVPYAEKDQAKRYGAMWDACRKTWYVENIDRLEPLLKWMPEHLRRPAKPYRQPVEVKTEAVKANLSSAKKSRKVKSKKAHEKAMKRLAEKNPDFSVGPTTPRTDFSLPDAACSCPPWEECQHVLLARFEIEREQLMHIRSIVGER